MKMVNLGYKNFVPENQVFAISPYRRNKSMKLQIERAREEGKLINWTFGNGMRSIILLLNGYVIISGIKIDTLNRRFSNNNATNEITENEEEE
jgi:regulator of extracellular matrix RemA (YlzA/DUF370 family)